MDGRVTVLRLGHRPGRDDRMTTHIGLTARALGADRAVFEPDATDAVETARGVTERFGGPFEAILAESPMGRLRDWDGPVVHLTMYGLPVEETVEEVRAAMADTDDEADGDGEAADGEAATGDAGADSETGRDDGDGLLVVVGAEKVPFEVYERADYNVGVTNQPHSEVAALAVFLDRLFGERELERDWEAPDRRVVPQAEGKRVVEVDGGDGESEKRADDESAPEK
jgi:tRNA (cytidine56-2'-O)-methyltransferase